MLSLCIDSNSKYKVWRNWMCVGFAGWFSDERLHYHALDFEKRIRFGFQFKCSYVMPIFYRVADFFFLLFEPYNRSFGDQQWNAVSELRHFIRYMTRNIVKLWMLNHINSQNMRIIVLTHSILTNTLAHNINSIVTERVKLNLCNTHNRPNI